MDAQPSTASPPVSTTFPPVVTKSPPAVPKPRKRNKRSRSGHRLPPFVAVPWELLNSDAYIQLNNAAKAALIYFIGKPHQIYASPEYYDVVFAFPYREAKRLGFPSGTFFKIINELVLHGFLEPERKGGCYGEFKACNYFRLSKRWQCYGCADFQHSDWAGFIHKPRKSEVTHG